MTGFCVWTVMTAGKKELYVHRNPFALFYCVWSSCRLMFQGYLTFQLYFLEAVIWLRNNIAEIALFIAGSEHKQWLGSPSERGLWYNIKFQKKTLFRAYFYFICICNSFHPTLLKYWLANHIFFSVLGLLLLIPLTLSKTEIILKKQQQQGSLAMILQNATAFKKQPVHLLSSFPNLQTEEMF